MLKGLISSDPRVSLDFNEYFQEKTLSAQSTSSTTSRSITKYSIFHPRSPPLFRRRHLPSTPRSLLPPSSPPSFRPLMPNGPGSVSQQSTSGYTTPPQEPSRDYTSPLPSPRIKVSPTQTRRAKSIPRRKPCYEMDSSSGRRTTTLTAFHLFSLLLSS
jgi:hypothetical protein